MQIFFDTEFIERGATSPLHFISIGAVRQDGAEYYAEAQSIPWGLANEFVLEHVRPNLQRGDAMKPIEQIRSELLEFCGESPEFWAYYAAYDWVVLCQIFGTMSDLPEGWPMYCHDLRTVMDYREISRDELPPDPEGEHNALADARWLRDAWAIYAQIERAIADPR